MDKVGLLDEFCPHRGASLYFGRNAEHGLQCVYHGWKFDVSGTCIENPTCPDLVGNSDAAQRAYQTHEEGGLVWAYLGNDNHPPPLPDLGWRLAENSSRYVSKRHQPCHWLQALEVDIDSTHVAYLHREELLAEIDQPLIQVFLEDCEAHFEVTEKSYGLLIGARRNMNEKAHYWRVNHWLMPWYTVVPAESMTEVRKVHAWIPVDDKSTLIFGLSWHPDRDLTPEELQSYRDGTGGIYAEKNPHSYVTVKNFDNDYKIDREAQRLGELWTGISGGQEQDDMVTASMGPAFDRTKERLVGTDGGIIATRLALLKSVDDAVSDRKLIGIDGKNYDATPVSVALPRDSDWISEVEILMEGGISKVALATGGLDT